MLELINPQQKIAGVAATGKERVVFEVAGRPMSNLDGTSVMVSGCSAGPMVSGCGASPMATPAPHRISMVVPGTHGVSIAMPGSRPAPATKRGFRTSTVLTAIMVVALAWVGIMAGLGSTPVEAASLKPPAPNSAAGSMSGPIVTTAQGLTVSPWSSGTWQTIFQLVPGETYTYALTYETVRSGRWDVGYELHYFEPPYYQPPSSAQSVIQPRTQMATGELNFARMGNRDEIRFWFDIDGVQGNGTTINDIRALAGAVLVTALTGPDPLPANAVRMLAAIFQWAQWYDLFADSTFRDGLVWQVSQHPPHRFTATRVFGPQQFRGELTRGRDVILELDIDLSKPLPLQINAYEGSDYYQATLKPAAVPGPLR